MIKDFNIRARPFMRRTGKCCDFAMSKVGIAFKSSLHLFGFTFRPKIGVERGNVPLCKLEYIPANAIDWLWRGII